MKFEDINKRYSEVVARYMNKGYHINTGTMSGTQGEIAHIDLTNGVEIIRVTMETTTDYELNSYPTVIQIRVGRNTDKVLPGTLDRGIIWNNHLEDILVENYYEIGRHRNGSNWYGTKEECEAKWEKHSKRFEDRRIDWNRTFPEEAKKIVLAYLKKQPRCKCAKVTDIGCVIKQYGRDRGTDFVKYQFSAKGKIYTLK